MWVLQCHILALVTFTALWTISSRCIPIHSSTPLFLALEPLKSLRLSSTLSSVLHFLKWPPGKFPRCPLGPLIPCYEAIQTLQLLLLYTHSSSAATNFAAHSVFLQSLLLQPELDCSWHIVSAQTLLFQTLVPNCLAFSFQAWYNLQPWHNPLQLKLSPNTFTNFSNITSTSPSSINHRLRSEPSWHRDLPLPTLSLWKIIVTKMLFPLRLLLSQHHPLILRSIIVPSSLLHQPDVWIICQPSSCSRKSKNLFWNPLP